MFFISYTISLYFLSDFIVSCFLLCQFIASIKHTPPGWLAGWPYGYRKSSLINHTAHEGNDTHMPAPSMLCFHNVYCVYADATGIIQIAVHWPQLLIWIRQNVAPH